MRPARNLDTANAHRAGIGPFDAHDELHDGRFAGTVRTDQAEYFSALDAERHIFHGDETAEALLVRPETSR